MPTKSGPATATGTYTDAPASGGDVIDIADILVGFGGADVNDAMLGGFLSFGDSGGDGTNVLVDSDGGANNFTAMATLEGLGFVDVATSQGLLDDNIIVV